MERNGQTGRVVTLCLVGLIIFAACVRSLGAA